MGRFLGHFQCINEDCGSSDALALYCDDDSEGNENVNGTCFSCGNWFSHNKIARSSLGEELGVKLNSNFHGYNRKEKKVITDYEIENVKEISEFDSTGFRGINLKVNERYGILTEYDDAGNPHKQYYPATKEGKLVGYKVRVIADKDFYSIGYVGADCDVFGKDVTKNAKHVIICGGELDAPSAYQMLVTYFHKKGYANNIHVVSTAVGESGSVKHIKNNYEFFDQYEKIYLCYDSDEVGKEAQEKVAEVLPLGKVYLMDLPEKDPNDCLTKGKDKDFVNSYYAAKKFLPTGIKDSSIMYEALLERAVMKKIPLPPFMKGLSMLFCGGIPLKTIINFGAGSSTGKTTIVNELIHYWLFNSPYKVGVVTLEADVAEYAECLLSRHIQNKLQLIDDPQKKLEYLQSDYVKEKAHELFFDENGEPRLGIIDDRDGDVRTIQKKLEYLIVAGYQIICLDPFSDLIAGFSPEDTELFMKWQKTMVKVHDVCFLNIQHIRKSSNTKDSASIGGMITEESFHGSSSIFKSAHANVLCTRNKMAEDPVERNTTKVSVSKCRWSGFTGMAGSWYYCNQTHTLHDLDDYFSKKSEQVVLSDGFEIEM